MKVATPRLLELPGVDPCVSPSGRSRRREEAAVEAAVRAVRAGDRAACGRGSGPTPVEALEDRLGPLDWSRFGGRAYALLRAVHKRTSGLSGPKGGTPDRVEAAGAKYEAAYSAARARLSRAMTAA